MKETLDEKHKRFTALWKEHHKGVYAYCACRMQNCPDDVDDVVSEVFATLWLNILKDTEIDKMTHWLMGTAYKKICKKYIENFERRKRLVSLSEKAEEKLSRREYNIDDERMFPELIEEIYEKADKLLKEDEQELMEMHYDKRMSCEEIAVLLSTTPNAVKQKVYRTNCKLKAYAVKCLKEMK